MHSNYKYRIYIKISNKKALIKYLFLFLIIILIALFFKYKVNNTYRSAIEKYNQGNYEAAINEFKMVGDFKNSYDYIHKAELYIKYGKAKEFLKNENYDEAYLLFDELGDFEDSKKEKIKVLYKKAVALFADGDYSNAQTIFAQIEEYEDSSIYKAKCAVKLVEGEQEELYNYAKVLVEQKKYNEALNLLNQIIDYKDSKDLIETCERMIYAKTISAGIPYIVAIDNEGKVKLAHNDKNVGFDFSEWKNLVSIDGCGNLILGLDNSGQVYATAMAGYPYELDVSSWNDIVQVSTGEMFGIGLNANHTVVGIGRNADGQLNVSEWTDIVQIATTYRMTIALDKNGNLHFAGNHKEEFQQIYDNTKESFGKIIRIDACGGREKDTLGHVAILNDNNELFVIGDELEGEKNFKSLQNVKYFSCGNSHLIAIDNNNELICIGSSGTIHYDGKDKKEEMDMWPINNIVDISAGYSLTVVLEDTGEVYASGNEYDGQMNANQWDNIMVIQRY